MDRDQDRIPGPEQASTLVLAMDVHSRPIVGPHLVAGAVPSKDRSAAPERRGVGTTEAAPDRLAMTYDPGTGVAMGWRLLRGPSSEGSDRG